MRFKSRFDAKAGFLAIPLTGLAMLTKESHFRPPDAPKVTYISTFAEGRTDEEIRQSNIANQQRKEAREAELAELEARRIEAYKALGRATGLDVEAMEREAAIERAREEAEAEARRRELYPAGTAVDDSGE